MRFVIIGSAHSVHVRKISEYLISRGHELTIFSLEAAKHPSSPQDYPSSVKIFDKWPFSKKKQKLWFLLRLNQYLIFNKVDYAWFIYASSYGLLANKVLSRGKKIISVWGTDILVNSYKYAYQKRISRALNSVDFILATSGFLRTHTMRLTKTPIYLTPYGPDDGFFSKESDLNVGKEAKLFADLASFDKLIVCNKWLKSIYGIDVLLEAVVQDKAYFRKKNIGLVLTGSGVDEDEYKAYVRSNQIGDIVTFTGYLEQESIISLLKRADLAVFPSRSESFGVSVFECFALKKPVLVSDVGGFFEVSQQKEFGYFLESITPDHCLQKIKAIIEGSVTYDINAAYKYSEGFKWSSCMERLSSLLESHLNSNKLDTYHYDFIDYKPKKKVMMSHSESLFCDLDSTRARSIRVTKMREALSVQFNVVEIGILLGSKYNVAKLIRGLFRDNDFDFVYIEGVAGIQNRRAKFKSELIFREANKHGVRVIYYIPDAHEFWNEYLLATQRTYSVHLARANKTKLLKKLVSNKDTILAVPTPQFRENLIQRLPDSLGLAVRNHNWMALPPAVSNITVYTQNEAKVMFVYAGGIGPFYLLQRLLIALQQLGLDSQLVTMYLRVKDIDALSGSYNNLLVGAPISIMSGQLPEKIDAKRPIGVLLLEPTNYIASAIPVKFYSYLERGWPIVAYRDSYVGSLVNEFELGWVLDNTVSSISDFFTSDLYINEYNQKQQAVFKYRANQSWNDRVNTLVKNQQNGI